MLWKHVLAITHLCIFVRAGRMFRTQLFDVFPGKQYVDTCAVDIKPAQSEVACALLCLESNFCCSSNYYDGECRLNANCNGVTKTKTSSYAIRKPYHNEDCKIDEPGMTYAGTINKTVLGVTCQAWAVDEPHEPHLHSYDNLPSNYCRNPDNEYPGPWCYTTDPTRRFDFCPVFKCGTECGSGFFLCNCGLCIPYLWRCNGVSDCPDSEDENDCDDAPECLEDEKGLLYVGKTHVTKSGKPCQPWSSIRHWKHTHVYLPKNYCRNKYAFSNNKPRCYTGHINGDLEECEIPMCE